MSRKLSINVIYEQDQHGQPHGCPFIRLLRPLRHPSLQEHVELLASAQLAQQPAEVVIVERWWLPAPSEAQARALVAGVRARGATLLYTLDDNLLDVDEDEEGFAVAQANHRVAHYFLREADGLLVSTEPLAERLQHLNRHIRVLPNALDEQLLPAAAEVGKRLSTQADAAAPLVLGYMGTLTHAADLAIIVEPLRRLLHDFGERLKLQIIGVSQHRARLQALFGQRVELLDPGAAVHYEQFMPWFGQAARWDIALAPLTSRPFNRCKSDIKFLDYAAIGAAGIYSAIGPYAASIRHEETGLLVANTPDDWYAALRRLVEDAALRRHLAHTALQELHAGRTLHARAVDWLQAISELHGQAQQRRRAG